MIGEAHPRPGGGRLVPGPGSSWPTCGRRGRSRPPCCDRATPTPAWCRSTPSGLIDVAYGPLPACASVAAALAVDVPPVATFFHEVAATTNPLGLRGRGECGNPGLGAAIANAVGDALGVALTALPVTPARVVEASERARS